MTLVHQLKLMLKLEPMICIGYGSEKEQATKHLVEEYRGWKICYYYGRFYQSYNTANDFSSPVHGVSYIDYRYIGDGVYIAAFKEDYNILLSPSFWRQPSYWVRASYDFVDDKFVNPPDTVDEAISKLIPRIKNEIDEKIFADDRLQLERVVQQKYQSDLESVLSKHVCGIGE